ncbi:MAG: SWIM zinc finger family protein [Sulfurimonas sp.]|nr:SWIM zinc finger family protein [Sulfurimonas sp.]
MKIKITTKDIKKNINAVYYKRGVEYYSTRRVLKYDVAVLYDEENEEEYTNINSVVKGSSTVYTQDIDIYYDDFDIVIDGSCSCPLKYNCKHVAAVCIQYRTEMMTHKIDNRRDSLQVKDSGFQIDRWLQNLEKLQSSKAQFQQKQQTPSQDYFLTYRLDGTKSDDKGKLHFYKSKFLKNGSVSKGTKLDSYKVIHNYSYREIKQPEDLNILSMSRALFDLSTYNPSMDRLSGTLGYMILKDVVETGRCYYDQNQKPLSFKEGILTVEFEFKLYKGEYSLKSNLDNKEFRIFETKPPILLDISANYVQVLDIDIEMYKQLRNAPKIPKENIGKVYASVGKALPSLEIKVPKAIKVKKIETKPVPKIHLLSSNSLVLDFEYDTYTLKYEPRNNIKSFYEENKKIEIHRDLVYEDECKEHLVSLGFEVEIINDNICVSFKREK